MTAIVLNLACTALALVAAYRIRAAGKSLEGQYSTALDFDASRVIQPATVPVAEPPPRTPN